MPKGITKEQNNNPAELLTWRTDAQRTEPTSPGINTQVKEDEDKGTEDEYTTTRGTSQHSDKRRTRHQQAEK